jgi:plasmid stabilization system protein ParE
MKLLHARRFLQDVEREFAYWKERDPAVAKQLRERVFAVTDRLATFPEAGRAWRVPGARELVVPGLPYIVIYRIKDSGVVETLKLLHTAREVPHVH